MKNAPGKSEKDQWKQLCLARSRSRSKKKKVIRKAQREGTTVHVATLMDHLSSQEFGARTTISKKQRLVCITNHGRLNPASLIDKNLNPKTLKP